MYAIHPFTQKKVKLITDIYNMGAITTIDETILSSKNKRYWLMPVSDVGLVLYDNKTNKNDILIKLDGKKYDTIGLKFVNGVISLFGRTQIPNVFDKEKLSEYDIWTSGCNNPSRNAPYILELDSNGVPAIYDNNRVRVFPIIQFK